MKNLRTMGMAGGLVAAALVGGTLISVVAASPSTKSDASAAVATGVDDARYCELWQETFADELGVPVDDLVPAAKAATIATIDAAVEAGDLAEDVAERMKAKIEEADGSGCRLLGAAFHGWGRHAARVELAADLLGAAADALAMDRADLVSALRSGDSLEEVAEDQGTSYDDVSQAVLDAAKANLDELVAAGNLEQARADEILSNLDEALQSGEWPRHGPWHRGIHFGRDGLEDITES